MNDKNKYIVYNLADELSADKLAELRGLSRQAIKYNIKYKSPRVVKKYKKLLIDYYNNCLSILNNLESSDDKNN